jgi:hypothetical protein
MRPNRAREVLRAVGKGSAQALRVPSSTPKAEPATTHRGSSVSTTCVQHWQPHATAGGSVPYAGEWDGACALKVEAPTSDGGPSANCLRR